MSTETRCWACGNVVGEFVVCEGYEAPQDASDLTKEEFHAFMEALNEEKPR